eukprot:TRINITY_DN9826_c0_g1_i1.p1 TRINITY_DN9826_c0_g1~~TRINITY_DN9826_c0_g1_i1.p1  ORF type:complete len:230 (+),score=32.82 TRINITY_DN9826_c0_g1_i1:55-744(+)
MLDADWDAARTANVVAALKRQQRRPAAIIIDNSAEKDTPSPATSWTPGTSSTSSPPPTPQTVSPPSTPDPQTPMGLTGQPKRIRLRVEGRTAAGSQMLLNTLREDGSDMLSTELFNGGAGHFANLMCDVHASPVIQAMLRKMPVPLLGRLLAEVGDKISDLAVHPVAGAAVYVLVDVVKHPQHVRRVLGALMPHVRRLATHPVACSAIALSCRRFPQSELNAHTARYYG